MDTEKFDPFSHPDEKRRLWFMRGFAVLAVGSCLVAVTADEHRLGWATTAGWVLIALVAVTHTFWEISVRRVRRVWQESVWILAEDSDDPIATLAMFRILAGYRREDQKVVIDYASTYSREHGDYPLYHPPGDAPWQVHRLAREVRCNHGDPE